MNFRLAAITLVSVTSSYRVAAQAVGIEKRPGERHVHRLTIMMANSHIPSANKIDSQSAVFIAPTWGFNYDYWPSEAWGFGLHTDLVLQQFKIERHHGNEIIERINPIAVNAVALYRPTTNWTFLLGVGREFEKNESFNMFCGGLEFGLELPDDWELSMNLIYDNKINTYDSWMFGVGFSKLL